MKKRIVYGKDPYDLRWRLCRCISLNNLHRRGLDTDGHLRRALTERLPDTYNSLKRVVIPSYESRLTLL